MSLKFIITWSYTIMIINVSKCYISKNPQINQDFVDNKEELEIMLYQLGENFRNLRNFIH